MWWPGALCIAAWKFEVAVFLDCGLECCSYKEQESRGGGGGVVCGPGTESLVAGHIFKQVDLESELFPSPPHCHPLCEHVNRSGEAWSCADVCTSHWAACNELSVTHPERRCSALRLCLWASARFRDSLSLPSCGCNLLLIKHPSTHGGKV